MKKLFFLFLMCSAGALHAAERAFNPFVRYMFTADPSAHAWEPKGLFLEQTDVLTRYGSIVEYKGHWYVFYQNRALSGGKKSNRPICFEKVSFNEDEAINMVEQMLGAAQ